MALLLILINYLYKILSKQLLPSTWSLLLLGYLPSLAFNDVR